MAYPDFPSSRGPPVSPAGVSNEEHTYFLFSLKREINSLQYYRMYLYLY